MDATVDAEGKDAEDLAVPPTAQQFSMVNDSERDAGEPVTDFAKKLSQMSTPKTPSKTDDSDLGEIDLAVVKNPI